MVTAADRSAAWAASPTRWPKPATSYFFRPGHFLVYEADTIEVLEWNPADALQFLMDNIEDHARRVVAALAAESGG